MNTPLRAAAVIPEAVPERVASLVLARGNGVLGVADVPRMPQPCRKSLAHTTSSARDFSSDRLPAAMPRTTTLLLLAYSGTLLACSGNEAPRPTAASPQSAAGSATDKNVGQPTTKSGAEETSRPAGTMVASSGNHTGPVPGPSDPAWFRLDLFPGATMTSSGRTQKDEQGLYSTQMLLTLPAGSTRENCVDALHKAVSPSVPNLEQKDGEGGRISLNGGNDDYQVTLLCGEAKGKMSAYLSYRWLRPPPPQAPPIGL
jgi:hypothetical protein